MLKELKMAKQPTADKREYLRLNSVFPVEYALLVEGKDEKTLDWHQGFTSNVSMGGICLSLNVASADILKALTKEEKCSLNLRIGIPLGKTAIKALAEVAWVELLEDSSPTKYLIGLKFTLIARDDLDKIWRHARWVWFTSRTAVSLAVIFLLAFSASALYNVSLRSANKKLINNLIATQQKETKAGYALSGIAREKENLSSQLFNYTSRIVELKDELAQAQEEISKRSAREDTLSAQLQDFEGKVDALNQEIAQLMEKKSPLENEYAALVSKENVLSDEFSSLEQKKTDLQKTVAEKMYRWLKNHQNSSTGLVLSFEGDTEVIKHWAFIYDQALALNAFLLFDDTQGAQKILNFFNRALKEDFDGFNNGYYFDSGDVAEYTVHVGPNAWIGLAALQYTEKTNDREYLPLARRIADWLISIQDQDPAGGLRGGPQMTWFATEHNLDAYAFFDMMYQFTQEGKYLTAREKVLNWLKTYSMSPHNADYKAPPVKRGRGDATIATDTFAWSLAAIGPDKLIEIGMNPEEVMRFAEENCAVSVDFKRPNGIVVNVSGFDFAKHTHMPRGGMVSPEWTSQMVISYQMLGDYFLRQQNTAKSKYYKEKARTYLNELNKLIISSPSLTGQGEGCLPYATLENADTGHGWRTPSGRDTGSIAGTAYMLMAIKEFNPLALKN